MAEIPTVFNLRSLSDTLDKLKREGGTPKVLLIHPSGVEKFGGYITLRNWCESKGLKLNVSSYCLTDKLFFMDPPDLDEWVKKLRPLA